MTDDVRTVLTHLRPDWDPRRIDDVHYLSGGYANDNYAFQYEGVRYVIRIVRTGVPGSIPRPLERDLLQGALSGLTAPVVAMALPEGHLLSRYVEGGLLVDRGGSIAELSAYLAALHRRLPPFGWPHPIDRLIPAWFDAAEHAGYPVDRRWHDVLAALPSPAAAAPCHNDLNPWNVIVRGSAPADWCTLDWEWCGDHDPLFDAIALARGMMLAVDTEDELIDRYATACNRPLPSHDVRRTIRIRFHLRELAWALAASALRGDRPELARQARDSENALIALID